MATSERSTRLQTAYKVLETYSTLSPEKMLEPLAPEYTHQILPESLNMPARSKEEFAKHATGITSIFESFAMEPVSVFEDPEQNAVIAQCRMVGELTRDLGPWRNTCVIFMKFNEDGTQITEWKEFVDSARAALLRQKLMGNMDKNMDVKEGKKGSLLDFTSLAVLGGVAAAAATATFAVIRR